MTGPMETDSAVLSREAGNFDKIAGELKAIISAVESAGADLAAGWQGQAGTAAQQALVRFKEAGDKQEKELADISTDLAGSGIEYDAEDDQEAGGLSGAMNI